MRIASFLAHDSQSWGIWTLGSSGQLYSWSCRSKQQSKSKFQFTTRKRKTMKRKAPSAAPKPTVDKSTGPSSPPGNAATRRRPIRPIDRQKMRPWLEDKLASGELNEQLFWKVEGHTFAVKWKHAARHGYNANEDATVFKAWAIHTGSYQEGDTPDPNKWKANFRCALHSLSDVQEVTEPGQRKGQNALRIFRFLDEPIAKKSRKSKKNKKSVENTKASPNEVKSEDLSNSGCSFSNGGATINIPVPTTGISNVPDFQQLGMNSRTTITSPNLYGGGCVTIVSHVEEPQQVAIPSDFLKATAPSTICRVRTPSGDSGLCSSPSYYGSDTSSPRYQGSDMENLENVETLAQACSSPEYEMEFDFQSEEEITPTDADFIPVGTAQYGLQANWSEDLMAFGAPSPPSACEAVLTQRVESAEVDEEFSLTSLNSPNICDVVLGVLHFTENRGMDTYSG